MQSKEQQDVMEWKWVLKYIDEYEFMVQSDGRLEARFNFPELDDETSKGIFGFTIEANDYNPNNDLREEVIKWLQKRLENSVVNTI